jgi:hypothetical protein
MNKVGKTIRLLDVSEAGRDAITIFDRNAAGIPGLS